MFISVIGTLVVRRLRCKIDDQKLLNISSLSQKPSTCPADIELLHKWSIITCYIICERPWSSAEFYPATTDGPRTGREGRERCTQSGSLSLCHSLSVMEVKTRPASALICWTLTEDNGTETSLTGLHRFTSDRPTDLDLLPDQSQRKLSALLTN